jgi:hypothetical protein
MRVLKDITSFIKNSSFMEKSIADKDQMVNRVSKRCKQRCEAICGCSLVQSIKKEKSSVLEKAILYYNIAIFQIIANEL